MYLFQSCGSNNLNKYYYSHLKRFWEKFYLFLESFERSKIFITTEHKINNIFLPQGFKWYDHNLFKVKYRKTYKTIPVRIFEKM